MCYKYSFLLTQAGKILDGEGITESHSQMAILHQVDEDKTNKYEWRPPKNWPDAEVLDGLVKDLEVFTPKASALRRISTHLTSMFPTQAAFDAVTIPNERWHEQKVTISGREITIVCKPGVWEPTEGTWWAYNGAQVTARENSQVTAWGNSQVTAWGNSQVTAWGNSQVTAWGNSQVTARENSQVTARENSQVTARENSQVTARENSQVTAWENSQVTAWGNSQVTARENSQVTAWENSTIVIPANNWYGKVRAELRDKAVLLDRMDGKLVVSSPADVQTSKVTPKTESSD